MLTVYGDSQSGNCYKVQLLLSLLAIEHRWQHVDILAGDSQREDFLALSPNGKIPVLVLDNGQVLSESNAILNYLAFQTPFLPSDTLLNARVLQWQFFEQYSHEPYIAVARFINKYLGLPQDRTKEYQQKQAGGHKALRIMEMQLAKTPYLTGATYTIADISLFAYTQVADEGGFDLNYYPAILAWIERIKSHPRHIEMN